MRTGLVEELRETGIEVVAACAETWHRLSSDRRDRRYEPRSGPRGDFLYDVVRLSLHHLNDLARLGTAYAIGPARILERLYAGGSCAPSDTGRSTVLRAASGDRITFAVKLRNSCPTRQIAHISKPVFKHTRTGEVAKFVVDPYLKGETRKRGWQDDITIDADDSETLLIRVELSDVEAGADYEGRLDVLFSDAPPHSRCLIVQAIG